MCCFFSHAVIIVRIKRKIDLNVELSCSTNSKLVYNSCNNNFIILKIKRFSYSCCHLISFFSKKDTAGARWATHQLAASEISEENTQTDTHPSFQATKTKRRIEFSPGTDQANVQKTTITNTPRRIKDQANVHQTTITNTPQKAPTISLKDIVANSSNTISSAHPSVVANEQETLEELLLSLDWHTDNGNSSTMYEPIDFDMADDGFGLVPDCGDNFSIGEENGPDVPSSLDQLCDWLDITGGAEQADDYKFPLTTKAPQGIQPFPTFSTNDQWPI